MNAGDSLRQRIDAGLENCSHFIALLSPASVDKPWVRAEMDGAFIRKLEGSCRFIPLRHGLALEALPPLLRAILSPSIEDYETGLKALLSDIYEISRKPALGPSPSFVPTRIQGTGLSTAAEAVARLVIERSNAGMSMDPQLFPDDLRVATGLHDDDIIDAVDELRGSGLLRKYDSLGCGEIGFHMVAPESELFATLDRHFTDWNPEHDALHIAADMVNAGEEGGSVPDLAQRYGWPPRRMNPAIAYLLNRQLVDGARAIGTHPWEHLSIRKTAATRRFVRDRSMP
jgi:hypothetical protein